MSIEQQYEKIKAEMESSNYNQKGTIEFAWFEVGFWRGKTRAMLYEIADLKQQIEKLKSEPKSEPI